MQQDNETREEVDQFLLTYLSRAIGDKAQIPWRVATRLFDSNLIDNVEDDNPELSHIADVLIKDTYFKDIHDKPLFFLNDEQTNELGYEYFQITDFMGCRNINVIQLIAPCLQRTIIKSISSKNIVSLVETYLAYTNKCDLKNALITAAKLDEALMNDWSWNISILEQASQENLEDIVQKQLKEALNVQPSDSHLFSELEEEYKTTIERLSEIQETISPSDIESILSTLRIIGPLAAHLPWNHTLGFGVALENNEYSDKEVKQFWDEIDYWNDSSHPARWFQGWFSAVSNPNSVPTDRWDVLWKRVEQLVNRNSEGYELEKSIAMRYTTLLEFYVYRMESSLSFADTKFLYWSSSKLASDVIAAVSNKHADLDQILTQAVEDAKLVWQVAAPTFPCTSLRSSFLAFRNYWMTALQSSIGHWDTNRISKTVPDSSMESLRTFIKNFSLHFNHVSNEAHESDDLLIEMPSMINEDWGDFLSDENTHQHIHAHNSLLQKYSDPDVVLNKLSSKILDDDIEGIVALNCLNSLLLNDQISISQIFDIISSNQWLSEVEPDLSEFFLNHLVSSLLTSHWSGNEEFNIEMPHWAASRCAEYFDDESKRRIYFPAIVLFSVKGNTSSAIARVIFEDKDSRLSSEIANMTNTLKRILFISPSWLSGRIRAVLSVLST